jgi:hypothetical protein
MSKIIVNAFIMVVPLLGFISEKEILKIREQYYKASSNKESAALFYANMQKFSNSKDATILGYIGMSYMIEANYVWNPYNKLNYFNTGKNYLDNAIETDPKNVELRFLRYGVQTNAPSFLGYSSKIAEDKIALIKTYNGLTDEDLKARIKEYMKNSNSCSNEEKSIFK